MGDGCTDESACNYDASATDDNGSCTLPDESYDCDDVCLNDGDGNGVCNELETTGCQDPDARNYGVSGDETCIFDCNAQQGASSVTASEASGGGGGSAVIIIIILIVLGSAG